VIGMLCAVILWDIWYFFNEKGENEMKKAYYIILFVGLFYFSSALLVHAYTITLVQNSFVKK
jgi:hypothetical protein